MKAIKRTVAALLATLMLATSTSFTLAAEEYTDKEAVVVAKVNAAGIMTGTDKGFEPSKSLTRAEAAAIIVRMKGISESAVKTAAGTTLFTDVAASHWASGYVNQASNLGIVKGVSATEFAPDREVTVAEFTTMAVRALGAGQLVDSEGVWPTNYVNFANENGLLDDVNAIYTATASRMNAATIVANTLETKMWEKVGVKSNGEITWSNENGKTILKGILKIDKFDDTKAETCTNVSNKDKEFNTYKVADGVDLSAVRVGILYDFWMNDDNEVIGVWESEKSDLTTVKFTKIGKVSTSKVVLTVDGKDKEYKIDATTSYYLNEVSKTLAENKNAFGIAYLDGSKVESIYAEEFQKYGVVEEVKKNKVVFDDDSAIKGSTAATSITLNDEDNEYFITKDGEGFDFADLKEGDVIGYYTVDITSGTKYVAKVVTESVEGAVKAITSDNKVKIDGKAYGLVSGLSLKIDDEVKAYLNEAGKIVLYVEVEDAAADIAVVKYIRQVAGKYVGTYDYEVKLAYTDGTVSDTLTLNLVDTFDEIVEADASDIDGITANTADSDNETNAKIKYADNTIIKNSATYYTYNSKNYSVDMLQDFKDEDKEDLMYATITTGLSYLGKVVCYEVSGDEVTFCAVDDEYAISADNDDKIVVGRKSTYITNNAGTVINYYLTDSTKVFNIKADTNSLYNVKVEEIDVASLEDTTLTANYVVGGFDTDTKEIESLFICEESIKRSTEANFAFIKDVTSIKYNGKKAYEVEVVYMNGDEKTYTYYSEEANSGFACPTKGEVLDITLNGEFIVDGDALAQGTKTEDYLESVSVSEFVDKFNSKRNEIEFDVADTMLYSDDVLVMSVDKDGKFAKSSLDAIDELDETASANNMVVGYVSYKEDEDEAAEAVVIVIRKIESKDVADAIIKGQTGYTFEVIGNKITATSTTAGAATKDVTTKTINGLTFTANDNYAADEYAEYTYTVEYTAAELALFLAQ